MADPLKVALVGCGLISLYHLRAWQAAGAEAVAVCDLDRAKAEARAAEFAVPRIYTDAAEMFADGGFAAVDIAASVGAAATVTARPATTAATLSDIAIRRAVDQGGAVASATKTCAVRGEKRSTTSTRSTAGRVRGAIE